RRRQGRTGVTFLAQRMEPMRHGNESPAVARLILVLAGVVKNDQFALGARIILPQKALDQLAEACGSKIGATERREFHKGSSLVVLRFSSRRTAFCHVGDISEPCSTCDLAIWWLV